MTRRGGSTTRAPHERRLTVLDLAGCRQVSLEQRRRPQLRAATAHLRAGTMTPVRSASAARGVRSRFFHAPDRRTPDAATTVPTQQRPTGTTGRAALARTCRYGGAAHRLPM